MAIKVIGTGLGRTGTKTLKLALEHLGYTKCFHMMELMQVPERLKYIKQLHKNGSTNWEALFAGYQATVDYPTCLFYPQLLQRYPDAKVILTLRDAESWYESVLETIYRGKPKSVRAVLRLIYNLLRSSDMRRMAPIFQFNDQLIWSGQFQGKFEDKALAISVYEAWIERVKAEVPSDQLLLYRVQEGWEPLCQFLGHAIPDTEFPYANQRQPFNQKMDRLLIDGVLEF